MGRNDPQKMDVCLICTPLLTNLTSVSRESSQTHAFSSVFVTDLVRSPVIGTIASCGKPKTKRYNLLCLSCSNWTMFDLRKSYVVTWCKTRAKKCRLCCANYYFFKIADTQIFFFSKPPIIKKNRENFRNWSLD